MRSLVVAVLLSMAWSHSAWAQSDADLDAAKQFLMSQPPLARLVDKAATKVAPGVYQLKLDVPDVQLFVAKQGSAWVAALTVSPQKLALTSLIPQNVLGRVTVKTVFLVVASAPGTLSASATGGQLQGSLKTFGKDAAYVAGANLFTQLEVGSDGTLGALQGAGLLPKAPMWLTGTTGGVLVDALLGGSAPDLKGMDFSLTLGVPSMVPAPFNVSASPKLTLGDATFSFTRTAGSFSLRGEQLNSKLVVGPQTFLLPKTLLTFTSSGDSYEVTVEGRSAENQPWRNAFGLEKVDLKSVSLGGTVSSTKTGATTPPIRGFGLSLGARVAVNKKDYDGAFLVTVENNALKELAIQLSGELNLGFIPGGKDFTFKQFAIAVTPASNQAALGGELQWKNLNGQAAVVLSQKPMVFVRLKNLDLTQLIGKQGGVQGMPSLPPLDAVVALGSAGQAGDVSNLPSLAQSMIDEVSGTTGGKVKVVDGLTVLTRIDAATLGIEQPGQLVLGGSVDPVNSAFRIAATLPAIPPIKGLPQGFGVEAPEAFLAVSSKGGSPVASFGLGLRLLLPIDGKVLAFKGSIAASTSGTFSFTGALETDWVNPIGLEGLTILAPVVVTIGVSADASVDLGFQAGMSIAKQKYQPVALCLNLQAAAPAPFPKKIAFKFKGTEIGPQAQMDIMEALVKSVANGPLKNSLKDPNDQRALALVGPGVDKISDSVDALNLPLLSITNFDFALTTPAVQCDLPGIEGLGIRIKGTGRFMGKQLAETDSYVNLTQGLKISASVNELNFIEVVKINNAAFLVTAPMPGSAPPPDQSKIEKFKKQVSKLEGELSVLKRKLKKTKDADDKADLEDARADVEADLEDARQDLARASLPDLGTFMISGNAQVLRASGGIKLQIDRVGAEFDFTSELADLGAMQLHAQTEGQDLTKAKDFEVELNAQTDAQDKILKKLGQALKASAAARKQLADANKANTEKAIKDTQAEFDRLDAQTGKDFRKAQKDVRKAKAKVKKAKRAIAKAKRKCKDDLGPAWKLCDVMDAAKETLKVANLTLDASKKTLKGIEKSADFARLQTSKATLATLKGGSKLADAGLAGWGAVDSVGNLILAGGDLVEIEEVELRGSLRDRSGSLSVVASVGDEEIERSFDVDLSSPNGLDLAPLVEEVANEVTEQASRENSPVWKALRKKK